MRTEYVVLVKYFGQKTQHSGSCSASQASVNFPHWFCREKIRVWKMWNVSEDVSKQNVSKFCKPRFWNFFQCYFAMFKNHLSCQKKAFYLYANNIFYLTWDNFSFFFDSLVTFDKYSFQVPLKQQYDVSHFWNHIYWHLFLLTFTLDY